MVTSITGRRLGKWLCSSSQKISNSCSGISPDYYFRTSYVSYSKQRLCSKTRSFTSSSIQKYTATAEVNSSVQNADKNEGTTPFESLENSVHPNTLKAVISRPFNLKQMTPVQEAVLPLLPGIADPYNDPSTGENQPEGRVDLLVRAKTGTGKTIAFLMPAIEARLKAIAAHTKKTVGDAGIMSDRRLEERAARLYTRKHAGCLIISPTRELAIQIASEAVKLSTHHEGFEVRLFTGGASKRMQMRDWTRGRRDIVVGTPGRMRDLLTSEPDVVEGLKNTPTLILDEADTLLDMGFRDDIEDIIGYLPKGSERQTFLFSATVSPAIRQIARKTLQSNHLFINTVSEDASPVHAHIPQYHTVLPSAADQLPHLLRLLAHDQLTHPGTSKVIVFLPTTKMTQLYATFLRHLAKTVLPAGRNSQIYEIHSKRTQEARTNTSDAFRRDKSGAAVLVTSDVSARGVDYPGTTRVIQVGIPSSSDQYIHRVGRTGRAQTTGRGDLVLQPWESGFVKWQLTEVPLKSVTTNELKNELQELATKYDSDGSSTGDVEERRNSGRGQVAAFRPPVANRLNSMDTEILNLFSIADEEAIKETFASLLGYYVPKFSDLRVQKGDIVQGCKDWTTEACGLPNPPYVSEQFLAKIGYNDGRNKRFGSSSNAPRSFGRDQSRPSWMSRGNVSQRTNSRPGRGLFDQDVDSNDDPNPYRGGSRRQQFTSYEDRDDRSDFQLKDDGFRRRRERQGGFGLSS